MAAGVAVRDLRGRSIATGSKSETPAAGSSREATGVAGFLAAVEVDVVVAFAPVLAVLLVDVVFDEPDAALLPAFDVVVEVLLAEDAVVAADFFEVTPGFDLVVELEPPLMPRSFLTLLVTELT